MKTLKEARAAGFHAREADEYGGEEITIKGRVLVCQAEAALSATEWGRRGFRVPDGIDAHAVVCHRVSGRRVKYAVYRRDQVVAKRKSTAVSPRTVDILAALWTVNRSAKRYRDAAKGQYQARAHSFATNSRLTKEKLYALKDQAVAHLAAEGGFLRHAGWHRFGDNWAEVLEGGGYRFHRPVPPPRDVDDQLANLGDAIEAKPRGAGEPRLKDAVWTLEQFLAGKPRVEVYRWPPRDSSRREERRYAPRGDSDDDDDDDDDDDYDRPD